jgi:hypothetical protein
MRQPFIIVPGNIVVLFTCYMINTIKASNFAILLGENILFSPNFLMDTCFFQY